VQQKGKSSDKNKGNFKPSFNKPEDYNLQEEEAEQG
jgi:hypothetical protein